MLARANLIWLEERAQALAGEVAALGDERHDVRMSLALELRVTLLVIERTRTWLDEHFGTRQEVWCAPWVLTRPTRAALPLPWKSSRSERYSSPRRPLSSRRAEALFAEQSQRSLMRSSP